MGNQQIFEQVNSWNYGCRFINRYRERQQRKSIKMGILIIHKFLECFHRQFYDVHKSSVNEAFSQRASSIARFYARHWIAIIKSVFFTINDTRWHVLRVDIVFSAEQAPQSDKSSNLRWQISKVISDLTFDKTPLIVFCFYKWSDLNIITCDFHATT